MEYIINGDKTTIHLDLYGNVYIEFGDIIYQLEIENDKIILIEGQYSAVEQVSVNFNHLVLYDEGHLLKKKVKEHIEKDEEDFGDDDNDYNHYFPQDNDYYIDEKSENSNTDELIYEDIENFYGTANKPFLFAYYSPEYELPIYIRQNGDVCALYDTYIYDNKLCFKSYSADNSSIYKLSLFKNGLLQLKSVSFCQDFLLMVDGKSIQITP